MGKVLVTESYLEDIGDSIRSKNGTGNVYKPSEMSGAIDALVVANLGTKSITANGTYNASDDSVNGYSQVTVNVPSDTLVSKTITTNGTYDPTDDSADGYSSVTVNVSGGGSVVAFVRAYFTAGLTVTATDGLTTLTSDTSGDYVFEIPNTGTWTFSDGTISRTVVIAYTDSRVVYVKIVMIYDNGTEYETLNTTGSVTKADSYIQITTGAGTFKNYLYTASKFDLSSYNKICIKYIKGSEELTNEFDISEYTGSYYLSFGYLTDNSHNEATVGVNSSSTNYTATFYLWTMTSQAPSIFRVLEFYLE